MNSYPSVCCFSHTLCLERDLPTWCWKPPGKTDEMKMDKKKKLQKAYTQTHQEIFL